MQQTDAPQKQFTIEELFTLVKAKKQTSKRGRKFMPEREEEEPLKYVLYARKSTPERNKNRVKKNAEDEEHGKSIKDQIRFCQEYADNKGLSLYENPIEEEKSAKRAERREEFAKMIEELRKPKNKRLYNSILCWHPDRLSRNMRDAGEIMDLLDDGIIKDLKFVTYTFTNDPSGRLALGVVFVVAQNYSEILSVNVKRGTQTGIEKAKESFKDKHGYKKDIYGYARPHGANYDIIYNAWRMKLSGKSPGEILKYLNSTGYKKAGDPKHEHVDFPFIWRHSRLSQLFEDSFYCGLLIHGENWADIRKRDSDFAPMVTIEEFLKINPGLLKAQEPMWQAIRRTKSSTGAIVRLLPKRVRCGYCDGNMASAPSKDIDKESGTVKYISYFRCENKKCPHLSMPHEKGESKKNSIRGRELVRYAQTG